MTKEDNEKFFRRLRLKAHFNEDSSEVRDGSVSAVSEILTIIIGPLMMNLLLI